MKTWGVSLIVCVCAVACSGEDLKDVGELDSMSDLHASGGGAGRIDSSGGGAGRVDSSGGGAGRVNSSGGGAGRADSSGGGAGLGASGGSGGLNSSAPSDAGADGGV